MDTEYPKTTTSCLIVKIEQCLQKTLDSINAPISSPEGAGASELVALQRKPGLISRAQEAGLWVRGTAVARGVVEASVGCSHSPKLRAPWPIHDGASGKATDPDTEEKGQNTAGMSGSMAGRVGGQGPAAEGSWQRASWGSQGLFVGRTLEV